MKITEGRIGNWVLVPTNTELKIPSYPKKIKGITKFGEFDFTEPEYPKKFIEPALHCAGVPLIEQVLFKAGLKQIAVTSHDADFGSRDHVKYYNLFDEYILLRVYDRIHLLFDADYEMYEIRELEYIHELQNIYHDLTKNELKIEL